MDRLKDALKELGESDYYPFHMPGHKRRGGEYLSCDPFLEDITEIDGFDNLHHPEGILKKEQEFAAEAFGAEASFFLVNGSSCGVMAAIAAVVADSSKRLLMGRNGHRSAYNGLYFANARADYLYPEEIPGGSFLGGVTPEGVREAVDRGIPYGGIFLTSPTYEGIVSDVEKICEIAHEKNIPVIVDEAHGAHLGLFGGDGYFPEGALSLGADLVIESLHKTLPAMTQTAVLHVQGNLVDRERLKMFLSMFQSSSPSYVLMESISSCIHFCMENKQTLSGDYKKRLQNFYERTRELGCLEIITPSLINRRFGGKMKIKADPGKLLIGTGKSGLSGKELYDIFRKEYHLQMEMADMDHVLAMTSIMDTDEGFERLICALKEIDLQVFLKKKDDEGDKKRKLIKEETAYYPGELSVSSQSVYSIREACAKPLVPVDFEKCAGQVSGEFIYLYPPGIPVVTPGEKITKEALAYLEEAAKKGLSIQGLRDYSHKKVYCIQK